MFGRRDELITPLPVIECWRRLLNPPPPSALRRWARACVAVVRLFVTH